MTDKACYRLQERNSKPTIKSEVEIEVEFDCNNYGGDDFQNDYDYREHVENVKSVIKQVYTVRLTLPVVT